MATNCSTHGRQYGTDSTAQGTLIEIASIIGHKWYPVILHELCVEDDRGFSELHDAIDGVSNKMLSDSLSALESEGLVDRAVVSDKPVRVGDFCTFGSMSGTVEGVGIRSTQIRALNRTLISVPNAKFVDMEIVNWARCDTMLIEATLGLRYETSDDQLRYVLIGIREMLHAHPRIEESTIRVRFAGYGESSLDVSVRIYALTRDWNEFYAIREDVNFHIKRIVEASGTGFALPASVMYTARDGGLDEERTAEAEEAVAKWRHEGMLAFPRLTLEQIERLRGTVDYPPEGSSERAQERSRQREESEPLSDPESRS